MNLKSPITQFLEIAYKSYAILYFILFLIPPTILDILHEKENYGFFQGVISPPENAFWHERKLVCVTNNNCATLYMYAKFYNFFEFPRPPF